MAQLFSLVVSTGTDAIIDAVIVGGIERSGRWVKNVNEFALRAAFSVIYCKTGNYW